LPLFEFLQQLFSPAGFPPRWVCGTGWLPFTGWFMITADLLIFTAYTSIPMLLLFFIRNKKDMPFPRIFWLFASFIFFCGISHLLDATMFWFPVYRLNALERFITGVVSWVTVLALIPIIPKALSLKTPAELENEINERRTAERQLKALNENLEKIVSERTRELSEKAWALEAANRELETFTYSVSHDLKAPLRKIEQFSDILKSQYSDGMGAEAQDYLERLTGNAEHMNRLIDDLLDYSRTSVTEVKIEMLDLSAMAQELIRDIRENEPARQVSVRIHDNMHAKGDPQLMRAVLQNLLENAWKYTVNHPQADIVIGRTADGAFYVKDNGIGYDPAYADRLFRPFQRLVSRADYPGTGLGLANVQRIITRHGGQVWTEGHLDQGATFYFTLPDTVPPTA
jgi:chemotaxis family two-component system sensor kinase Cph1